MTDLTSPELVIADLTVSDKHDALRQLSQRLFDAGRITDLDAFLGDIEEREARAATGLPGGIAIPHAKSEYAAAPAVAFGLARDGVAFGATDGPATLIFLTAAPAGDSDAHLRILARLARALSQPAFKQSLLAATSAEQAAGILNQTEVSAEA